MKASVDAFVSAQPDVVFAAIWDIESWPRFIAAIRQVEMLTPGAINRQPLPRDPYHVRPNRHPRR